MTRRRALTWGVFAGCVASGAALLLWLSATMLALERAEARARAHAQHEVAVGAALWQMDAWLLPLLTAEAQRPISDYQAFPPVPDAYTNLLSKLGPGEVVTPSPLLSFRSPYFLLHFQIDAAGRITSPQVPEGNALDVAQSQGETPPFAQQRALLTELARVLSPSTLFERCSVGVAALPEVQIANQAAAGVDPSVWTSNYADRAQSTKPARQKLGEVATAVVRSGVEKAGVEKADAEKVEAGEPGQLVPLWLDDRGGHEQLAFVRAVGVGGARVLQGVIADWARLQVDMLAQIREPAVATGARLVRVDHPDATTQPRLLTVVPAALETVPPDVAPPPWSSERSVLLVAWLALLATAMVVAFTLRAALSFGDRRARFASAVTHELRTPLTTFKMYSEMLAQGMVTDPDRRQHYLTTLQHESDRLARLVENVLGYARIEDGRARARIERVTLPELIERVRGDLERRAEEAAFPLSITVTAADARLDTDVDAVGQILFNLVDNACKYGRPPLVLTASWAGGNVQLGVRDHGPGIPAVHRARIFAAFDRGARQPGDNEVPGIGLGLALARGLARDLGGRLALVDVDWGACFALTLPARRLAQSSGG